MTFRLKRTLVISTILGAALASGAAFAQQPPPAGSNASAPSANPPAPPPPPAPPRGAPGGTGRGLPGLMAGLDRLSPGDRAAVIDARIAALKAGLELSADQQKLWQPVEAALRKGADQAAQMRQTFQSQGRPTDPMQRLTRLSEVLSARADWLKSFVQTAQPLYQSLTPEQKARLPLLMGVEAQIGAAPRPGRGGPGGPGPQGRGPQERGPRGGDQGAMGPGPDGRRGDGGRERMGRGGDQDQPTWRERMRDRMRQMNQSREEWRGGWRGSDDRGGRDGGGRGGDRYDGQDQGGD
jgi:hypothetical protein